jgi:hypothetical protein
MRALFLCPSPFEIGTYFRAIAFARHLVKFDHFQVDLVCTSNDERSHESDVEGVHVIQTAKKGPNLLPMRGWNPGEILGRFSTILKGRGKYDLIYSFEYQPSVAGIAFPLSFFTGAVHFNDWCDWYAGRHHKMAGIRILQKIDAWMEEFPRRRVDCVTTINRALFDRALASGVSPEKLMLVREGADAPGTTTPKSVARTRLALRKYGISDEAFIAIAMLDQETDVHEAAIAELANVRPGARLVLLGKVPAEKSYPRELVTPGRVCDEDLDLWLNAADCAWLPLADTLLNRGRLPHKIGHFRRYGLPLLTCAVGDVPKLGDPGIHLVANEGGAFSREAAALPSLADEARRTACEIAQGIYAWDVLLGPWSARIAQAMKR